MESTMEKTKTFNTLWGNVFSSLGLQKSDSRIMILKGIPIFNELSNRELKLISKLVYERNYTTGESVFEIHQPGAAMFIIEDGEVQIVRQNKFGEEIILAELGNGEFFGELAMLDNSPRSATAKTSKTSKMMAIFREDLDKFLKDNPEIGVKVLKKLAIVIGLRLKSTNELLLSFEEKKQEII